MTASVLVDMFGSVVEVATSFGDEQVLEDFRLLAGIVTQQSAASPVARVSSRDRSQRLLSAEQLLSSVVQAAVKARSDELWVVRGVALATAGGDVALLCRPGTEIDPDDELLSPSDDPLSADSLVGVDLQGRVYAVPLVGRFDSSKRYTTFELEPRLFSTRLTKIVVIETEEESEGEGDMSALALPDALRRLVSVSPYLCSMTAPLRALGSLIQATDGVSLLRSRRGAEIEDVMRIAASVHQVGPVDPISPAARASTNGIRAHGALFRTAFHDALSLPGGETAILRERGGVAVLHVLDATESAVWNHISGRRTEEVVTELRYRGGDLSDADRVAETVAQLLQRGLVGDEPIWRVADDVAWVSSQSTTTAFDLATPGVNPVVLEATSHSAWLLISERGPLLEGEIIWRLAEEYGADREMVRSDVTRLLHDLWRQNLVYLS